MYLDICLFYVRVYAGGRRERRQAGTEHASQDVRTRRADEHSRSARAAAAIHRRVRDMPCYYAPGAGAVKCCDDRVRVCVCLRVCLSLDYTSDLRQIISACYLRLWLGPMGVRTLGQMGSADPLEK